jgi:hypothetical protein
LRNMSFTEWLGLTLIATNCLYVIAVLAGMPGAEVLPRFGSSDGCLSTWANASVDFRDELTLISRFTMAVSLIIVIVVSISASIRRDIRPKGPGNAPPLVKVLLGVLLLFLWSCYFGLEEPISSISDAGTVTRAFFNHSIGVFILSVVHTLLAFQVAEDIARIFLNHVNQGRLRHESNRRRWND